MSKQDYVQIAAALKETGASRTTALAIAAWCKLDNVAFDLHVFLKACGHPAVVNVAQSAEALVAKGMKS